MANGGGGDENDASPTNSAAAKKQLDSLMEHTRLKNISICKRRLPDMPIPDLVSACLIITDNVM